MTMGSLKTVPFRMFLQAGRSMSWGGGTCNTDGVQIEAIEGPRQQGSSVTDDRKACGAAWQRPQESRPTAAVAVLSCVGFVCRYARNAAQQTVQNNDSLGWWPCACMHVTLLQAAAGTQSTKGSKPT